VRWELRPRTFLRSSEFLWQEGHTAHATFEDAAAYARQIAHDVYEDFMVNVLALPVLVGRKTTRERFPGAVNTITCEAMMGDGKALQNGTSHELGQNFAKAFGIGYLDDGGQQQTAWTTSWGVSTRMVGGLIMGHGDDRGLRVPPRLAPIQVVVLAVRDDAGVVDRCRSLAAELVDAGIKVELDLRTDLGFGRRATDWELKGIPVRLELGPRDLDEDSVTLTRRISGTKGAVPLAGAVAAVHAALDEQQVELLDGARTRRDARTVEATSVGEVVEAANTGFARIGWDALGREDGEETLAQSSISVRCLLRPDGTLPEGDDEPDLVAVCAKAY
jgi:prolyl-tRNA synthetase